jgi:Na+/H+ antiporter NhaD/arsenite permease-like protein|tara:strand:+ start:421 stop:597 length:177 start_codon:yes stop_codon:yes gene_type:complete
VVIGFFFHGLMDLPPSIIALIGAAVLLTWVSPHKDPKSIFKKVELSVLVFFLALFVLV